MKVNNNNNMENNSTPSYNDTNLSNEFESSNMNGSSTTSSLKRKLDEINDDINPNFPLSSEEDLEPEKKKARTSD